MAWRIGCLFFGLFGVFNLIWKLWLRVNVHERGSECDSVDELMVKVTGKPLDAHEFVAYLVDKYTKIYDL